ncbi:MAG: response regulator [Bacteroidota bacterium]
MNYRKLKNILLLEDSEEDIVLIKRQIVKSGLKVHFSSCSNKVHFFEQLDSFTPDLILSDYHIPFFHGFEAIKVAKEKHPNIPFVFVTGKISEDLAEETMLVSADAYVLKENLKNLPSVIKLLWNYRRDNHCRILSHYN